VVVVDDSAADRDLYCLVVRGLGLNAVAASTGWEGLVCARTLVPAAVLTDLHMCGLDGWRLRDVLAADPRTASVPVILITGDTGALRHARGRGFAALLSKPVELSAVQAALLDALAAGD
jgi:CheY-like chemotaxis protein